MIHSVGNYPFCILRGNKSKISINYESLSLKIIIFFLANSEDPGEMAFHLGLHCLPKYVFTVIQNENS